MYFHESTTRPTKQLLPGVLARTFWGEKMLLSLVDLHPHAVIPPHSHPHEQIGMCLEGEFGFTIGDETHRVTVGDVVFIPAGAAHSYENTGDGAFEFLCIVPNQEDKVTIVGEGC